MADTSSYNFYYDIKLQSMIYHNAKLDPHQTLYYKIMTIIRIQVEIKKGKEYRSFAVNLMRQTHRTIEDFVRHIKKVLNLDESLPFFLSIDGFALPMKETTEMITKKSIYQLIQTDCFEITGKKSKKQQKQSKIQQKQIKKTKKISSSSSESSSSSSSESKQEQQQSQIKPKVSGKKAINQTQTSKKAVIPIKKQKPVQSEESESYLSQSQSSEQLPRAPVKIAPKKIIQSEKKEVVPPKKLSNIIQSKPKVILKDSSSQSESITPVQQKKKEIIKPPIQKNKIPPSLRNKSAKSTFSAYKEQQWLPVTKQSIIKFVAKGFTTMCQPKNQIRFKLIELDQQKFIPVTSDWITAEVDRIDENGKVFLKKFNRGKEFLPTFEIQEHNMDSLEIQKLHATPDQLEVLSQDQKEPSQIKNQEKKEEEKVEKENQDKNSIQKFIIGQINYYFSDKNYTTDLYMQMHANNHPQKYINIRFFLNFPKIKKILRDQQKLFQYLITDEKREERNYEIDETQRMIRKKQISMEPSINNVIQPQINVQQKCPQQ